MNHYETLGVARDATPEQIKAAYRKASKKAHPDKGGSDEAMAAVNQAHDVLSDPERRKHYDRTGQDGVKVQTIEERAQGVVLNMFDEWLKSDNPPGGNLIELMKNGSKQAKAMAEDQIGKQRRKIVRWEKSLKRIRGPEFFGDLVRHKIKEAQESIAGYEEGIKVTEAVTKLLGQFTDTEPEAVKPNPFGPNDGSIESMLDLLLKQRRFG